MRVGPLPDQGCVDGWQRPAPDGRKGERRLPPRNRHLQQVVRRVRSGLRSPPEGPLHRGRWGRSPAPGDRVRFPPALSPQGVRGGHPGPVVPPVPENRPAGTNRLPAGVGSAAPGGPSLHGNRPPQWRVSDSRRQPPHRRCRPSASAPRPSVPSNYHHTWHRISSLP